MSFSCPPVAFFVLEWHQIGLSSDSYPFIRVGWLFCKFFLSFPPVGFYFLLNIITRQYTEQYRTSCPFGLFALNCSGLFGTPASPANGKILLPFISSLFYFVRGRAFNVFSYILSRYNWFVRKICEYCCCVGFYCSYNKGRVHS